MKKILVFPLLFFCLFAVAQNDNKEAKATSDEKNEIKINTTNLIIFSFADVTYERLLNEESSVGLSVLFNLGNNDDFDFDYYRTFSATGFYRHFFSNKYAKGFFVEGFGMLHKAKESEYIQPETTNGFGRYDDVEYTDFALGISAGGKFVTPRGFIAEIYLGIGRNVTGSDRDTDFVGRGGISLGYRF
ncbi:DUF3575 domain-containing protein [Lacinutrix chionoecetis]